MPQSLARVVVHIIFSTEHRQPWLKDANVRAELYAYMATVLSENVDSPARAAPLGLVDGQSALVPRAAPEYQLRPGLA